MPGRFLKSAAQSLQTGIKSRYPAYISARWCVCWAFWVIFCRWLRGISCILRCILSGSFPRPLPPERECAAFADLRRGGSAAAAARDTLIRHNLRLVAHICKKYYAGDAAQDDYISIGTIGLIKAVDTFDPDKGKKFASYASRCIENELRMELRRTRRAGPQLSLQEPLEAGGQLTLADTLPDETDMEADCEQRADAARLRSMVEQLPGRERQIMRLRYGFGGAAQTQQQTAQTLHISRSYV